MNQLAHIFITYVILQWIIPDARLYILPIVVFSIIIDLDHIPGLIAILGISKKKRTKMTCSDYADLFRTAVQEPVGIITIEMVLLVLYLFVPHSSIVIAMFAIVIHWVIDFLTVHTRPFVPLNDKLVCLFFDSNKARFFSELVISFISAILFLVYF